MRDEGFGIWREAIRSEREGLLFMVSGGANIDMNFPRSSGVVLE